MFKCDQCKKSVKEKQNKLTVEKRQVKYHYYVIKLRKPFGRTETFITEDKSRADNLNKGDKLLRDYTGKGWEIVQEQNLCDICYKEKKNG